MLHIILPERWSLLSANRLLKIASISFAVFALATLTSATTTTHSKPKHAKLSSAHSSSRHHSAKPTVKSARSHGQHSIGEDRTREIQTALIREHYLSGEPSGTWDQASKDAMLKYQAANGWQTKITPILAP